MALSDQIEDDWQLQVSQRLRSALSPQEYETWFAPVKLCLEESRAVVVVPNHFFSEWIQERYHGLLRHAISSATGRNLPVAFQLAGSGDTGPQLVDRPQGQKEPPVPDTPPGHATPLNPRYTFDNFVVGPCNELAHAACRAVAEKPGQQYNPLVIFGAAGLGKTHLLVATGNYILERAPSRIVHYTSSEAFTNELIQAVRYDGITTFREKYRQVDVLLIDDIQFLADRERTQEEFFHTFNALYDRGKQIILTSDKLPRDISGLEKRLQTRFEWGLITDLQPPDEETKVAILQRKAAEQGLELSRKVAFYLASQPESNVRILEGYLTRIIAVSRFQGVEVTLDLVKRVVGPMVGDRKVSLEDVLKAVAGYYGVKVSDLKGNRKTREVTHPRQVAMYLARRLTRASYPEIGRAFGNKDHSTVVKGVQKIVRLMNEDPAVAERVRAVERILQEPTSRED